MSKVQQTRFRWKDYLVFGLEWYRQSRTYQNFDFLQIRGQDIPKLKSNHVPTQVATKKTPNAAMVDFMQRVSFGKIYYGLMQMILKRYKIPRSRSIHADVLDFLKKNHPRIGGAFAVIRRMREWADYYERKSLWKHLRVPQTNLYEIINSKLGIVVRWLIAQRNLT